MDWQYIAYEKIPENINRWNLTESDYRNFKKKIPEFAEDSRYHQAQKWNYRHTFTQNQNLKPILSLEDELCQEMLNLVTLTRLDNVISKFGRITNPDKDKIQQLIQLLEKDVLESFKDEYETIFNALSVENQNNIMVELHNTSQKLVNNYIK